MKNLLILFCASLVIFLGVSNTSAASFIGGELPTVSSPIEDDAFVSGEKVVIQAPILGELFAAGSFVNVNEKSARSVFAAGSDVTIEKGSGYNIFAAGNNVTLKGEVAHDVYLAGNKIIIDPSTVINGNLYVAGNEIIIEGQVKGDVNVSGNTVVSDTVVGGNFSGDMSELTFSGGSIGGNLTYKSPQDSSTLSKVTVGGTTMRSDQPVRSSSPSFGSWLWWGLATFLAGAAAILLLPRKLEAEMESVNTQWFKTFIWGFVALFMIPIVTMLLMVTVVGIPLALILLAAYIIGLYFAGLVGQFVVGAWLLKKLKAPQQSLWLALIVGIVVIAVVKAIPVIGPIASFLLGVGIFIPAFGAMVLWLSNFTRQQQHAKS